MAMSDRYQRLLRRRAPLEERALLKFAEAYEKTPGEATRYLLGAMRAVDSQYTKRMVEQGDRVENQLDTRLKPLYPYLGFRRQGSVSNLTHIRYYSDVDVLVIIDKFVTLEPPQRPDVPYTGVPTDDLLELRKLCARELVNAFPQARINDEGTTCIVIDEGSLKCPVDVVPSNWYDTNAYANGQGAHTRGVMVLNKKEMTRAKNYPFLFNFRLDTHDRARMGAPRMLIRLLKSVRADLEEESSRELKLSSFDICSLVYRMPDIYLQVNLHHPLDIVRNLLAWIDRVVQVQPLRDALMVVDDSRIIFDTPEKGPALRMLHAELNAIYDSAVRENGGYKMFTEAHVAAA